MTTSISSVALKIEKNELIGKLSFPHRVTDSQSKLYSSFATINTVQEKRQCFLNL